ncbi:hypothetical protein [Sphingomicrobium nitratireducens]|uniref:hypothetical protein n=1 Tax=Sphingomicrobium nitratireducens TaxID=2964666 RepID=UPI00223EB4E8|nr:hypothetical protein [Sphingomicrobium nitratireducens]
MSSSGVYFIGFLVLLGGLAYGAISLGVPPMWVGIGAIVLLGIGIMSTVTNTKLKEPAEGEVTRTTTTVHEE